MSEEDQKAWNRHSTQYFYLIDILEEISNFLNIISKKQVQANLMQSAINH